MVGVVVTRVLEMASVRVDPSVGTTVAKMTVETRMVTSVAILADISAGLCLNVEALGLLAEDDSTDV